jgi:hypothetical protein
LLGLLADAKVHVPARARQAMQTPQAQAGHSVAAPEVKA